VPEMRECEEDNSAFGFRGAREWRQVFREFLHFRILRGRLRLHASDLRLPLILGE